MANEFIDIHTHTLKRGNWVQILNCFPEQSADQNVFSGEKTFFSAGLHPWYIPDNPEKLAAALACLRDLAQSPRCLALGESGLDKLKGADPELQLKVFKEHIRLAETFGKALIIHCVRSYHEIIRLKKTEKPRYPWIIHGFRGNLTIAEQLLHHDFFLSFGSSLLNSPPLQQVFIRVPLKKLFLETDDSDCKITDLYQKASEIRNTPISQLTREIRLEHLDIQLK